MNFALVSAASLAILVLVYGATFVIGRRIGRYNVVDVTWGASFVAVAAAAAVVGNGDLFRRLLLLALVAVWGLRLAWHMVGKSAGKGEDPRYDKLLGGDFSPGHVIRKIFLTQAAMAWFVSLPLQLSASLGPTPSALVPVLVIGVALWVVGVLFEAVGDHQLRAVQGRPLQQGRDHGPRPVVVDAASQLLRRFGRVVGNLAHHDRGLAVALDGAVTGGDDVLPGLRHRRPAHGANHGRSPRLS